MTLRSHIPSLRARLRDTRGFMLAEQLLSVIFIGLLCIAVTAGLQAAMGSYSSITTQTQADALLSQTVETVTDELAYALDVDGDGVQTDGNPLYFTSATRHATAMLASRAEDGIWLNADGAQFIIAPTRDGLTPQLESLSYDARSGTWAVKITVTSNGASLADAELTVKRIGS